MTFVATASCAALLGAKVVFADVEEDTALLDPAAVEAVVTERTKVIAAVDYAGHPADYDALQPIADRVGAMTLEDAAHSVGGSYRGRPVGDLADVTTLSFFPTKNLTTGEGGAVVAKDPAIGQRAQEFHNIGLMRDPDRFEITDEGPWHQEVHEFGAELPAHRRRPARSGCRQLKRLAGFKKRRAEITARYNEALRGRRRGAHPVAARRRRPGLAPVPGADPRRPPPGDLRGHARGRHRRPGELHAGLLAPGVRATGLPARHVPERGAVLRRGDLAAHVPGPDRRRRRPGDRDADEAGVLVLAGKPEN